MACAKFGIEETKKIITDGLDSYKRRVDPHEQQQTVPRALLFAATNGDVHLDGVFALLRREPSLCACCLLHEPKIDVFGNLPYVLVFQTKEPKNKNLVRG